MTEERYEEIHNLIDSFQQTTTTPGELLCLHAEQPTNEVFAWAAQRIGVGAEELKEWHKKMFSEAKKAN